MTEQLSETQQSVARIQSFDASTLPRKEELGSKLNFTKAVKPTNRLVALYKQLGLSAIPDLPDAQQQQVKQQADADFNRLKQILDFDPEQQNPTAARDSQIQQVTQAYDAAFNKLHPYISYSTSKSVDFKRLETEARAAIQSIADRTEKISGELDTARDEALKVLDDVKKTAAEQGVSQQAIHFKEEADQHLEQSNEWRWWTIATAILLGVYAVLSLFIHKIPFLKPEDTYQSFQLAASKLLMFGVISYMLFLCARNFLAHRHNVIVNRHRQNALMTFTALVDAADTPNKDVILNHAAACIFAPQDTAYGKGDSGGSISPSNVIELLPKSMVRVDAS